MSIFNTNKSASILKPITPDPSKNSFTEQISKSVSKKPTIAETLSSKLSGIKSIGQTFSPSQQTTSSSSISSVTPGDGGVMIIKILLIVLIIVFLAYNLYLYFYEKTDIFRSHRDSLFIRLMAKNCPVFTMIIYTFVYNKSLL